jgi:hypothetical protein
LPPWHLGSNQDMHAKNTEMGDVSKRVANSF